MAGTLAHAVEGTVGPPMPVHSATAGKAKTDQAAVVGETIAEEIIPVAADLKSDADEVTIEEATPVVTERIEEVGRPTSERSWPCGSAALPLGLVLIGVKAQLWRKGILKRRYTKANTPPTATSAMAAQVWGMPNTGIKRAAPKRAPRQPPTRSAP